MAKKKRPTKNKSGTRTSKKGKTAKNTSTLQNSISRLKQGWTWLFGWINKTWTRRITAVLLALFFLLTTVMFTVAQWYTHTHRHEPYEIGATFIAPYARFYGLDAEEVFLAMTDDLGFEHLRLVSYWNMHEPEPGEYDFSDLDWQFELAEERGVDVSLAIGLRQPRWPECHKPDWAKDTPYDEWYPALLDYMEQTILRYKDSPALSTYQLENEFLLEVFGECPDHSRERLIEEFEFVKELDPDTPIVVSRSNNATPSWPVGEPRADIVGASVYKRVWDRTLTKRYFEYPLPAWFYGFLAGATLLTTDRDTIIHELQAEPWLPDGHDMRTASTEELYKSMSPEMLRERFAYGRDTGIRVLDMWGVEWWYYRKINDGDDSFWQIAREELEHTRQLNKERVRLAE